MPPPKKVDYSQIPSPKSSVLNEQGIEDAFIEKLVRLKYDYRPDIRDRAALEANFREKFEALNRVRLTDAEFARLLEEIITPDVFTASRTLRTINSFTRDDGESLNYSLVNLRDWCKNHFEVINQLRINTDNSHHRYDVLILINGVPCVQVELKTLGISPRRAMEQIVEYKNDSGNGYGKTLLAFLQLFIVSNRDQTFYFANNNARHFAFHAEERFLPVYEFADEANKRITHIEEFADGFLKKCDLGRTISRYMVLIASEQKLLVMRPYQVYAVQHMVKCIDDDNGNGFVWHTTGSGKTEYYNIFSCDQTVDSRFCEIYFRSDGMVAFYDDRAIGSLIEKRRVHFAAFLKFNIRFPRLPGQQRIASCLSSLEALITAETQKHEAPKTHKKGLTQQLFPSPEEVEE